ncbi:hypothetical protein HDV00_005894 [Rhizophlyctis rosea]|nr:hypothetical protein HDV00_005894 [Rhizophlyctis rosea]
MFSITLTKITITLLATTITTQAQAIDISTTPGPHTGIVTFTHNPVISTCPVDVEVIGPTIPRTFRNTIHEFPPYNPRRYATSTINGPTAALGLSNDPVARIMGQFGCTNRWLYSVTIPAGFICTISNCQAPFLAPVRRDVCSAHLHCAPPPRRASAPAVLRTADIVPVDDPVVDVVPVQVVAADVPGVDSDQYVDDGVGEVVGIVDGDGDVVGVAYE